jgi:hypothetical protein
MPSLTVRASSLLSVSSTLIGTILTDNPDTACDGAVAYTSGPCPQTYDAGAGAGAFGLAMVDGNQTETPYVAWTLVVRYYHCAWPERRAPTKHGRAIKDASAAVGFCAGAVNLSYYFVGSTNTTDYVIFSYTIEPTSAGWCVYTHTRMHIHIHVHMHTYALYLSLCVSCVLLCLWTDGR